MTTMHQLHITNYGRWNWAASNPARVEAFPIKCVQGRGFTKRAAVRAWKRAARREAIHIEVPVTQTIAVKL
jgi:hypothetical protein